MSKEPDRLQRKALGKGLSALLPSRSKPVEAAAQDGNHAELVELPLGQVEANQEQPRESFDQERLAELAQSIRSHGVIQPITVEQTGANSYRIIAGERRWRAAKLAGLEKIPAIVRATTEHQRLELALIENIQREELNPMEVATGFYRLSTEYQLSHEQIAERTGKERSTVTNFLRLLRLSEPVRAEVAAGAISMGHARALLNVADPARQQALCQEIKAKQLSVRAVESLVRDTTDSGSSSSVSTQVQDSKADVVDPNIRAAVEKMSAALGTKVKLIVKGKAGGRLEIEYYSEEDLDRIYSVIVNE